jgi:hypothetical protein
VIYPNNSTLASLRFASLRSSPTSVASVGVIFPITQAIGMGFSRRDAALSEFGSLLGHVRTLWGAFHCWEIQEGGGAPWVRMVQKLGDDGSHDGPGDLRRLFDELLTSFVVGGWVHSHSPHSPLTYSSD